MRNRFVVLIETGFVVKASSRCVDHCPVGRYSVGFSRFTTTGFGNLSIYFARCGSALESTMVVDNILDESLGCERSDHIGLNWYSIGY